MATGYTSMLEELNYDVPRWLKERAIRAMGVCVTLRDDEWNLSEKQIAKRLANFEGKDDDYHERALKEAKRKLKEAGEKSKADFKAEYAKKRQAAEKRYEKDLVEFMNKKAQYIKSLASIEKLMVKAAETKGEAGEVALGTLKFAKEQVKSTLEFDFGKDGPYKDDILDVTFDEWFKQQMKGPQQEIDYHKKEIEKKAKDWKQGNRADIYEAFVAFVNKETAEKK